MMFYQQKIQLEQEAPVRAVEKWQNKDFTAATSNLV